MPVPQGVPGATDIVTIAAGSNHNLALKRDGTVLAWGSDSSGQLGDGTVGGAAICGSFGNCAPTPQPVVGVGGVGLLSNIIAVSGGEDHSLALRADGRVIAWGSDFSGQLGDGTRGSPERTATPQLVPGVTEVIAIAAGPHHSLALKADGTIVSWGNDIFGELGDGAASGEPACSGNCNPTPQAVLMPTGTRATAISAGGRQSLALLADGTVLAWGTDGVGESGDGAAATSGCFCEATPKVVLNVASIVAIAAGGGGHNLALKADGTVVAWGRDGNGQLGDGSPQFSGCGCHPNAQPVPGLTNIVAIAAGFFHNFALKSDGTLMTWGANNNGQLGDGTTVNSGCFCRPTPQRVPGVNRVAAVIAGADTSLVILAAPTATATAADDKGAVYGAASVTLSATVTSGAGTVNGGPVTFTVKNAGSATVGVPVTGQVNASGVASATFTIPAGTPTGGYTVEASYGGAISFNASNDPSPATLTIGKAATSTTIGTPGTLPSCGSGSMTIPVTIANTSNGAALTGGTVTVTLTQGATVVGGGSAAVSGADPVTVNVIVALSGLGAGTVAVNASYGGDGNFQGSAAAPTSFVSPLTATSVAVPNATAAYGDASVTLTATVASANGAALTGGTVTFVVKKGAQVVATLTSGPVAGASPQAVSVTLPLDVSYDARSYSVTATYSGNACFATGNGTGTLTVARKVLWLKASDQTVGLNQPNPPTAPPANCLASATATAACGVQLSNGSGFVYGQSWSALNMTNLRFQYARNPPSTNATEFVGKTYRITAFGVSSGNYDIRYEQGTMTVVP
ncbi:MAG: Ig-like domain repeat protein [Thermomicrobiales bacterium]